MRRKFYVPVQRSPGQADRDHVGDGRVVIYCQPGELPFRLDCIVMVAPEGVKEVSVGDLDYLGGSLTPTIGFFVRRTDEEVSLELLDGSRGTFAIGRVFAVVVDDLDEDAGSVEACVYQFS